MNFPFLATYDQAGFAGGIFEKERRAVPVIGDQRICYDYFSQTIGHMCKDRLNQSPGIMIIHHGSFLVSDHQVRQPVFVKVEQLRRTETPAVDLLILSLCRGKNRVMTGTGSILKIGQRSVSIPSDHVLITIAIQICKGRVKCQSMKPGKVSKIIRYMVKGGIIGLSGIFIIGDLRYKYRLQ